MLKKILLINSNFIFLLPVYGNTTIITDDFVLCKRENFRVRQLCAVNEEKIEINTSFESTKEVSGVKFDYSEIMKNKSVDVQSIDGTSRTIHLKGFEPYLKGSIEWSTFPQCMRNAIWKNPIYINFFYNDGPASSKAQKFFPGYHSINLNISALETPVHKNIFYTKNANQLKINSFIKFDGEGVGFPWGLAEERIPISCNFLVKNTYMGFDPVQINKDLKELKSQMDSSKLIMNKSLLLHGFYLKEKKGLLCTISKLSEAIRSIELQESESWDSLSFIAKQTIIASMENAYELGAITLNSPANSLLDYWTYFKSEEFQTLSANSCTDQLPLSVSTSDFTNEQGQILNESGYNNAIDYLREKRNIISMMNAVWAFSEIGKNEVDVANVLDWALDSSIYANIRN